MACSSKTKFVIGVALTIWCVAFGVALPCAAQELALPTVNSNKQLWFGTMELEQVRQFRFMLHLTGKDGHWSGVLKSLDEGGQEFEVSGIVCTDSQLKFELPKTSATYEGKWDGTRQAMEGEWKQRGGEFNLAFRRVEERPKRKIKKVWMGTINALIQKLDVAFVELESGQIVFDSISQKAGGFFVKDESQDEEVIFRVPAVRGTFQGKYSEDKSQILGKWSQGVAQINLVLKQADALELVAKKYARPQTPEPPFPYIAREISFASKAKDVSLSATLTLPQKEIKSAVVLVSGSGPQDRDESLLGHKPFLVIADHFSRHGIAVLRYDDRGTGQSSGDFATATTFDFADDAEAALHYLRSLPELNGIPVGICGHSEGGIVAPIVAARNEHVDFIIMMAGPGVNGVEILTSQARLILEAEGVPKEEIQKQVGIQRALLTAVEENRNAPRAELEAKVAEVLRQVFTEQSVKEEDREELIRAGVAKISQPWLLTYLTLDPRESLTKLQCPVLVIQGEKDLQVDPELNLPVIRSALEEAENRRFKVVEYPGLNHLFQACETGTVSEYEEIEETFNAKPLRDMTDWIRSLQTVK